MIRRLCALHMCRVFRSRRDRDRNKGSSAAPAARTGCARPKLASLKCDCSAGSAAHGQARRGTLQTGDVLLTLFANTPLHRPVNVHQHQGHTHDRPANVHEVLPKWEWDQHSIACEIWIALCCRGQIKSYVNHPVSWRASSTDATNHFRVSQVCVLRVVKASMDTELPLIPDVLLMELSSLITTWEAIRKAKEGNTTTKVYSELRQEAKTLLAQFHSHLANGARSGGIG